MVDSEEGGRANVCGSWVALLFRLSLNHAPSLFLPPHCLPQMLVCMDDLAMGHGGDNGADDSAGGGDNPAGRDCGGGGGGSGGDAAGPRGGGGGGVGGSGRFAPRGHVVVIGATNRWVRVEGRECVPLFFPPANVPYV